MPTHTPASDTRNRAAFRLRHWSYALAAVLGLAYVVYVVVMKLSDHVLGGPLGELGEFTLVLTAVVAFSVGLFADEAGRARRNDDT